MPPPITAAKGQINICLEGLTNQGMFTMSNNVPVTATITPTNAIPATPTTPDRVVIWIMGNTALGTFTINGTGPGGAVTEGPINVPAANPAAQTSVVGKFEYESTNLLTSLTSITTTGLTNGTVSIFAVQGGKYLTPGILKSKKKFDKHSPNEHRNLLDKDTKAMQTLNKVTIDEFSQIMYPENSMWVAYMVTGSVPTISTVAGFSTVLKTNGALSGGTITLTTPPNPGSQIQFVISSSTAVGTITINGTNAQGSTISEVIQANGTNGNGTYTSVNFYWTTTSITYTGLTTGSAAVNGIGPSTLLAATAVAATMSLTTQPAGPGMPFTLVVAGTTVAGTIGITGTNQYGVPGITETITVPTNGAGVYYSANIYSAIAASAITTTGLTGGTLAISGVYGWKYVFLPGDVVYSATLEKYNGVDSFSLPWFVVDEATFEFGMDKEFKLNTKGIAQDRIVIGDRTAASLTQNRVTAIGQPGDLPMVGWQSLVYIDTAVAAVPTTQYGDLLEGKIQLKCPQKGGWTATNSQNYNRVNRGKRETTFDGKIDLTNVLQHEQYRQNLIQYITFQMLGQAIGGGNNKTWQFTFPVRWDDFDIVSTPDMERVEATVKALAEYDGSLGGSYKLTIVNQQPPVYPN